ncbi:hypothetical protein MTR_4g133615 [Medicago truncatula]|uniref:Uncharacterized protein n=1 Tax=Medicago truncatula TaxID=3880 RepID=A0A072US83_MEDTR|nr:hypothetical protein MTR_4g133615 [Medicago truncatula]
MALEVLGISFPSDVNNGHCNNKICHWHGHFLLISNVALAGVMIDPQEWSLILYFFQHFAANFSGVTKFYFAG